MHASHPAPQRLDRAPDSAAGGCGKAMQDTLLLLLPIKRASDIIYGARYARRLQEWGIKVSVSLLHVTPAPRHPADGVPQLGPSDGDTLDLATRQMMHEAGLYLNRTQIVFSTHIFAGELLFTILDAAELLGCHEIVLPAFKPSPWQRRFSGTLARRLARATRCATVLLADTDGMSGAPPA